MLNLDLVGDRPALVGRLIAQISVDVGQFALHDEAVFGDHLLLRLHAGLRGLVLVQILEVLEG